MKISDLEGVEEEPGAWPTDGEYDEKDIRNAHYTLVNFGGMLGVVYRRQMNRNRELRKKLAAQEASE